MLTLQIENQEVETIFLEGFSSNKDKFFEFIQTNYKKMVLLNSLDTSLKQAKLQENGELSEISLKDLIDDIKNSSDT